MNGHLTSSTLRARRRPSAYLWIVVAVATLAGCSRALDPARIADAQLAVRVKTALVNDPAVGAYPIEVRVANSVARLSGRVDTEALRQQAVALARAVPGIAGVESALVVGAGLPDGQGLPSDLAPAAEGGDNDRRLLAIGMAVGRTAPVGSSLASSLRVGPIFRLGAGSGLGLAIGFGWFDAGLRAADGEGLGRLKVKPVMAGLGYTVRNARASASMSLVGGIAFNAVEPDPRPGVAFALDAANSLAWRPSVSLWYELGPRVAFNVFTGYVFTSPRTTFFEDGGINTRRVRADTGFVKVGLAYKLF